jgi:ABC-type transport system substrate-binding protein
MNMTFHKLGWHRAVLIISIVVSIFIIACSSDDEAAPSTSAPPTATSQAASQPTAAAKAKEKPKPTAAAKATAVKAKEKPPAAGGGHLKIGVGAVCPPIFNNRFLTGSCFERVQMWGFTEGITFMKHAPVPVQVDEEDRSKSMLESWSVDDAANTMTWVIKTGIPFHDERWGDVNAHDVAFSFNEAMAEGSTFNRAGQLRQWISSIEATDDRTVLINCTDAGCQKDFIRQQSNYNGQTASITSKLAFETLGEEDSLSSLGNMTGPFEATKWVANETIESRAVKPHWRHTPFLDMMTFVEIPEISVRLAAIINGEIQLADLPPRFVAQAVAGTGGRAQQIGGGSGQGMWFAGNYWATSDYLGAAGEGNDPKSRPGYTPDESHPWIGEWGNDESMERALKVRTAMGMMINWEQINEKIFGGLGDRGWSYYGWTPDHDEWNPEWQLDYDPEGAQALLAEAGYADGFEFGYWIPPDVAVVIDPEFAESLAQMWVDGGLSPKIEKTAYSARRPTLVSRSIDMPWAWNTSGASSPKDTNAVGPHVPRAGSWNSGTELPDEIGGLWQKIEDQREPAEKRKLNVEVSEFINHWRTFINFVETTPFWAVRSEVEIWEPYAGNLPYFGNPQTIKMK